MAANCDSTRTCTHCKTTFPATLDYFPAHKLGKFGLHSWCIKCKKEIEAARRARPDQQARQQAWRDANKDKVKVTNAKYRADGYCSTEDARLYRQRNIETVRIKEKLKQRKLRALDPDRHRMAAMRHYYKNRPAILVRANARSAAMYRNEPWFNLRAKLGARIRRMLAGCGGKARRRTEALLGYSYEELARHLERQFTKGMTWEKLLAGEIHIDHIIPVVAFKASSPDSDEFLACWSLSNLRPMWAVDNLAKSGKVLSLL